MQTLEFSLCDFMGSGTLATKATATSVLANGRRHQVTDEMAWNGVPHFCCGNEVLEGTKVSYSPTP
jgi:hypothetical protein